MVYIVVIIPTNLQPMLCIERQETRRSKIKIDDVLHSKIFMQ